MQTMMQTSVLRITQPLVSPTNCRLLGAKVRHSSHICVGVVNTCSAAPSSSVAVSAASSYASLIACARG